MHMHTSIIFTDQRLGTVSVREHPRVQWFRISRRIRSMTPFHLAKVKASHIPSTMSPNQESLDTQLIPKNMTQKLPLFLQNKHKRS